MILVLSGTSDGREIVHKLAESGHQVTVTVVTAYGAQLQNNDGGGQIITGSLEQAELEQLITQQKIKLVVDATHPYAEKVSSNARAAAENCHVSYLRYRRPSTNIPENQLIHLVKNYTEAARVAFALGDIIFVTTGSKNISLFADLARQKGKRVIARVLPDEKSISQCIKSGILPGDIVAMQGPFSIELNKAMFSHTGADVLLTKDSGDIGGTDTKIKAALEMSIPVVLIERPPAQESDYRHKEQLLSEVNKIMSEK